MWRVAFHAQTNTPSVQLPYHPCWRLKYTLFRLILPFPTLSGLARAAKLNQPYHQHEQACAWTLLLHRRQPSSRRHKPARLPPGNRAFPALASALFALERAIAPARRPSTHCVVNFNCRYAPHVDPPLERDSTVESGAMLVAVGMHTGGQVMVEGTTRDVRYTPVTFDSDTQLHWTQPFEGERFTLVWFTPARREAMQVAAARIANEMRPPLKFRLKSTDANAITEVSASRTGRFQSRGAHGEKGEAYEQVWGVVGRTQSCVSVRVRAPVGRLECLCVWMNPCVRVILRVRTCA
eukprot:6212994-Pleurochrysis_carterae.AAC.2